MGVWLYFALVKDNTYCDPHFYFFLKDIIIGHEIIKTKLKDFQCQFF